jgi:hypothetical protein
MKRRLEDRIKELCAQVVTTADTPERNKILQRLTTALYEHTRRMRTPITELPVQTERRSLDQV